MRLDLHNALATIIASGFFGGVCSFLTDLIYDPDGKFRTEIRANPVSGLFVSITSGIVGVCGALAIQILVLGMRFYEKAADQSGVNANVSDFIFLIAICVIAGFGSRTFLFRLTDIFEKRIGELDAKASRALNEAEQANTRLDVQAERQELISTLMAQIHDNPSDPKLEFIVARAKKELDQNPTDGEFALIAGRALRRLTRLGEAIEILTRYINSAPVTKGPDQTLSNAYYNRACYNALLNEQKGSRTHIPYILADLGRSLDLSPDRDGQRQFARYDDDFKSVRDRTDFKEILSTAAAAN